MLAEGSSFGPFRIVTLLGKGGMASVYKAYEAGLDRFVALKVLPAELLHDATFARRFEREAHIIARLEHPNIVPIYRYGIDEGLPWMSMRLLPSGTLSGRLQHGRPERRRVVAIVQQIAAALDCAHRQGVTHRDVKPSNILLDEAGRCYVADFGIAKLAEANVALSRTGMIAGTPRYMAPEQGRGDPVDQRADVYALGIMAYEMLTGRVPFDAETPVAVLYKHANDPVPIPSPDLVPESILRPVLKAIAKDPGDRWHSAGDFASALALGALSVEPTALLPWKADQPRPRAAARADDGAAGTDAARAAEAATVPLARPGSARPASAAAEAAPGTVPPSSETDVVAPPPVWEPQAGPAGAGQSPAEGIPPAARRGTRWLRTAGLAGLVVVAAGLALAGLGALGLFEPPEPVELTGHGDAVVSAAFSPDGRLVVTASADGTAGVWQADGTGEPRFLAGHTKPLRLAALSPDGTLVLTASDDGTARIWRTDGAAEPVVLAGHQLAVVDATFSPDGARVVTASRDATARVWRVDGREPPIVLRGHGDAVESAVFSPDGSQILTASLDGTVRLWPCEGGGSAVVLNTGSSANMAAFSPDGTLIVTAEVGYPAARLWRADGSGEPVVLPGHTGSVVDAAFSPDGTLVATASINGPVRVYRTDGAGEPVELAGHTAAASNVAFSPDGRRVVSGSADGAVRLWRADGRGTPAVFADHHGAVLDAAFSPDGARVVTASRDGTSRIWWPPGRRVWMPGSP